jgi:ketosteroid isomerase-like protein
MSTEAIRALVQALDAAIESRDAQALRRILHPDFRYHVPAALPGGGVYEGPESLIGMLEYSDGVYQRGSLRFDREPAIVEDDRAAWRFTLTAVTITGEAYTNRYACFIKVQDGRIIEMEELLDTLYLNRMVFKT